MGPLTYLHSGLLKIRIVWIRGDAAGGAGGASATIVLGPGPLKFHRPPFILGPGPVKLPKNVLESIMDHT